VPSNLGSFSAIETIGINVLKTKKVTIPRHLII